MASKVVAIELNRPSERFLSASEVIHAALSLAQQRVIVAGGRNLGNLLLHPCHRLRRSPLNQAQMHKASHSVSFLRILLRRFFEQFVGFAVFLLRHTQLSRTVVASCVARRNLNRILQVGLSAADIACAGSGSRAYQVPISKARPVVNHCFSVLFHQTIIAFVHGQGRQCLSCLKHFRVTPYRLD
jgi:hypothetical protein